MSLVYVVCRKANINILSTGVTVRFLSTFYFHFSEATLSTIHAKLTKPQTLVL